jgi:hypothetical protein
MSEEGNINMLLQRKSCGKNLVARQEARILNSN